MSLCLFDYAYGLKPTDELNEFRLVVHKFEHTNDLDFQIFLRELDSLRKVALDKNIYMEPTYRFAADNRLMSVREFATYIGVGMNVAYNLVKAEDCPTVKIGTKIMIDKYRLDDYIDTHKELFER